MEFKAMFIAVVIFSMIIVAVGVILATWGDVYSSEYTNDLGALNKLDAASAQAGIQKGNINPESGEASSDYEANTYRGVYGIITNIFSPTESLIYGENSILESVVRRYGIPAYVLQGIMAIIIFAIIFALVAIIFRSPRATV